MPFAVRSKKMNDPVEQLRNRMVTDQLEKRGIYDPRVLRAMRVLPRQRFVTTVSVEQAYADCALPIECDQTISQPYMVALMTEALRLEGGERVLEIGTGSGYQTAVLAALAAEVVSIERHGKLSQAAGEVLQALGYANVRLIVGDGSLGCVEHAPYDRIMVTAGSAACPPPLWEQLVEGGLVVLPVGDRSNQVLQRMEKVNGQPRLENLTGCRFVPLVGAQGW